MKRALIITTSLAIVAAPAFAQSYDPQLGTGNTHGRYYGGYYGPYGYYGWRALPYRYGYGYGYADAYPNRYRAYSYGYYGFRYHYRPYYWRRYW